MVIAFIVIVIYTVIRKICLVLKLNLQFSFWTDHITFNVLKTILLKLRKMIQGIFQIFLGDQNLIF